MDSTSRSCVVVGNFNPAILNPNWVAERVFREPGIPAEVQILGGVGAGPGMVLGAAFSPRFKMKGLAWVPAPNRLEVFAESEEADAGDFVATVLKLLPHTPVQAVGSNFIFTGPELSKLERQNRPPLLESLSSKDWRPLGFQSNIRVTHDDGVVIAVQYDSDRPGEFRLNFHRAVKAAEPDGIDAAKHWRSDASMAERLLKQIRGLADANSSR